MPLPPAQEPGGFPCHRLTLRLLQLLKGIHVNPENRSPATQGKLPSSPQSPPSTPPALSQRQQPTPRGPPPLNVLRFILRQRFAKNLPAPFLTSLNYLHPRYPRRTRGPDHPWLNKTFHFIFQTYSPSYISSAHSNL